jgi:hypothetical protein
MSKTAVFADFSADEQARRCAVQLLERQLTRAPALRRRSSLRLPRAA